MIHVVAMKCLIGLPLLIHIEFYEGVGVGSFKNRGVGVGAFVYRLHSPAFNYVISGSDQAPYSDQR
jgi:hypothetical protein